MALENDDAGEPKCQAGGTRTDGTREGAAVGVSSGSTARASVWSMMAVMAARSEVAGDDAAGGDVDLAALHRTHYRELVKLASLLVHDVGRCEELAQEAFVALAGRPGTLRDPAKAPAYLRSAVLNGARSLHRRRDPVGRLRVVAATDAPPERPDDAAGRHEEEAAVLEALRALPHRQQAVLVLRYWLELPESEIAATLGIGAGTVKTHAARGLAALASRLEDRR